MSAYELGNKTPPVDVAARLAMALGVSIDWLFGVESKDSAGKASRTYGDLVRLFLLLADTFPQIYLNVNRTKWSEDPRVRVIMREAALNRGGEPPDYLDEYNDGLNSAYASIEIPDRKLVEFFTQWKKIYEMLKDGALEEEIYQAWIEKRLWQMSQQPIRYVWPEPQAAEETSQPQQGPS